MVAGTKGSVDGGTEVKGTDIRVTSCLLVTDFKSLSFESNL
jgi:hypothetical protein